MLLLVQGRVHKHQSLICVTVALVTYHFQPSDQELCVAITPTVFSYLAAAQVSVPICCEIYSVIKESSCHVFINYL
jgi:hypothetical protein